MTHKPFTAFQFIHYSLKTEILINSEAQKIGKTIACSSIDII